MPIKRAATAPTNAAVTIRFADGARGAVLGTYAANVTSTEMPRPRLKKPRKQAFDDDQDQLF